MHIYSEFESNWGFVLHRIQAKVNWLTGPELFLVLSLQYRASELLAFTIVNHHRVSVESNAIANRNASVRRYSWDNLHLPSLHCKLVSLARFSWHQSEVKVKACSKVRLSLLKRNCCIGISDGTALPLDWSTISLRCTVKFTARLSYTYYKYYRRFWWASNETLKKLTS